MSGTPPASVHSIHPPPENDGSHSYPHVTDGETESQSSSARCPRSPKKLEADLSFIPCHLTSQLCVLTYRKPTSQPSRPLARVSWNPRASSPQRSSQHISEITPCVQHVWVNFPAAIIFTGIPGYKTSQLGPGGLSMELPGTECGTPPPPQLYLRRQVVITVSCAARLNPQDGHRT